MASRVPARLRKLISLASALTVDECHILELDRHFLSATLRINGLLKCQTRRLMRESFISVRIPERTSTELSVGKNISTRAPASPPRWRDIEIVGKSASKQKSLVVM